VRCWFYLVATRDDEETDELLNAVAHKVTSEFFGVLVPFHELLWLEAIQVASL